jgi:YaiO family outer membrane protein
MEPWREFMRAIPKLFRNGMALLWMLVLVPSFQAAAPIESSAVERARQAITSRDLQSAAWLIEGGLADDPYDLEWRLLHSELLAARGQLTLAILDVQEIGREQPDDLRCKVLEAQWLCHLGRLQSAQQLYERLLRQAPDDLDLRARLALTFAWRGDGETARTHLERILLKAPYHEVAFIAHLRVLIALGHSTTAWNAAQRRDRDTGELDAELGLLMAGLAARVGAIAQAHALAARTTSDPDLQQRQGAFRAVQYHRQGETDLAGKWLESLLAQEFPSYDALIEAANANAAVDRLPHARELFERALALTPERPEAQLGLARLASREGRPSGCLSIYQELTRKNPEALEAWLGITRVAQLLNDPALMREALEQAWHGAPRSSFLHRERLRLALLEGDTSGFEAALKSYLDDQPSDRSARLWELRWRHARAEPIPASSVLALLDPMAPDITSQALGLLTGDDQNAVEIPDSLPNAPDPTLQQDCHLALAQHLAVTLRRDWAIRVARTVSTDAEQWVEALANGWWAYLSTPLVAHTALAPGFDSQARAVWLADQVQRRLRTLTVETDSPIEEEWLIRRALWFDEWRGRWASEAAGSALQDRVTTLVPDWCAAPQSREVEEAWRRAELPLPLGHRTGLNLLLRARWRHYRFDHDGAVRLLRELDSRAAAGVEAAHARVEILRASGRWSESLALLGEIIADGRPSPLVRIQHVELLRRLGRYTEATRQLDRLDAEQFHEPDYFLQRALLARAVGHQDEAWSWLDAGLAVYSEATLLLVLKSDWLQQTRQSVALAQLVERADVPGWINPDILAMAWPHLGTEVRNRILQSPQWWFNWHWLPWERLACRSVAELERRSQQAAVAGECHRAIQQLIPALDSTIPDSDLWLKAGRLLELDNQTDESVRAYRHAELLGLGRTDALTSALALSSRSRPNDAAREFTRRLNQQPDDPSLRKGLVLALLRAGQVTAADRALAPLVETLPDDPETQILAAQVRNAMGRVRQARSLYNSLLRDDPLHADARAGRLALRDTGEWGVATGYEYAILGDITGEGNDPADWQEAHVSAFWRRPFRETWKLEYRWIERNREDGQQVLVDWSRGLNRDWLMRLNVGTGLDGDIVPRFRAGAGASHRFSERLHGHLDARYLRFSDVDVWQAFPGALWRWHPRGSVEARVYLSYNVFQAGADELSVTWLLQTSWQLTRDVAAAIHYARGNENSLDPIPGLIANDTFQSIGAHLELEGPVGWSFRPAYRYERHQRFDLHAFGLAFSARF